MNIIEYAATLKKRYWIDEIANIDVKQYQGTISNKYAEAIIGNIENSISDKDTVSLINWLTLGLYFDENKIITLIRKKGTLRKSKYDFEKSVLHKSVEFILQNQVRLNLIESSISYFNTLKNIYRLSIQVSSMYIDLNNYIKNAKPSLLKTLLCHLDALFFLNFHPDNITVDLTKEDISEAISFMVYLFCKTHGINDSHSKNIDEELIISNDFNKVIIEACRIKLYMKCEILVDYFNYSVTKDSDSFLIFDNTEELEKSIQLGFIRTEIQRYNTFVKLTDMSNKSISLAESAINIYKKFGGKLFVLKTDPIERLVFQLPSIEPLKGLADAEGLFREEIHLLGELNNELYVTIDDLKNFKISGNLSLYDILKVKRIFSFITAAFSEFLKSDMSASSQ